MLLQREISPKARFVPRKHWSKNRSYTMKQTGQSLLSWYALSFFFFIVFLLSKIKEGFFLLTIPIVIDCH